MMRNLLQRKTLLSVVVASSTLIAAAWAYEVLAAQPAAGTISYLQGRAFRAPGEKADQTRLKKGSEVYKGDLVRTGKGSRLEIRLTDGSAMRLGPESAVRLDETAFDAKSGERKVSARLVLGNVWAKVTSLFGDDENDFEITTENAVAGVRGTSFRVNAAEDKSTMVRVYSGSVAVAGNRPAYQTHEPGKQRKQVQKPGQVSRERWEQLMGKEMGIRISAAGIPEAPLAFDATAEAADDQWVAWNRDMDEAWENERRNDGE